MNISRISFIIIIYIGLIQAKASPRDLAADVSTALDKTRELEAQRVLLDAAVMNWNNTYWGQSTNINQAYSLMQTEGVPTSEVESIKKDVSNCNVDATNFVQDTKKELTKMQNILIVLISDLENNYLNALEYENDLLNQSFIKLDSLLNKYYDIIVPEIADIENKFTVALTGYDTSGAIEAKNLVNESVIAINEAFYNIQTIHNNSFNTAAIEAINAIDAVVSQVPTTSTQHVHPTEPTNPGEDPCAWMDTGSHNMRMYFHGGYCEVVLFEFWVVRSIGDLILSMFIIMVLTVLFEVLGYLKVYSTWKASQNNGCESCTNGQQQSNSNIQLTTPRQSNPTKFIGWKKMFEFNHLIDTFLFTIIVTLSFTLMMIFMTFNYYLALAIILGQTIGYFSIGWKKQKLIIFSAEMEHCH